MAGAGGWEVLEGDQEKGPGADETHERNARLGQTPTKGKETSGKGGRGRACVSGCGPLLLALVESSAI